MTLLVLFHCVPWHPQYCWFIASIYSHSCLWFISSKPYLSWINTIPIPKKILDTPKKPRFDRGFTLIWDYSGVTSKNERGMGLAWTTLWNQRCWKIHEHPLNIHNWMNFPAWNHHLVQEFPSTGCTLKQNDSLLRRPTASAAPAKDVSWKRPWKRRFCFWCFTYTLKLWTTRDLMGIPWDFLGDSNQPIIRQGSKPVLVDDIPSGKLT